MTKKQRVAVLGSGIAGLSAAWIFSKHHEVCLYEKASKLGLGQKGVDISTREGNKRIDVPIRVFSSIYYPKLHALCQYLNVPLRYLNNDSSFSDHMGRSYFRYFNLSLKDRTFTYILPKLRFLPWMTIFLPDYFKLKKDLSGKTYRINFTDKVFGDYLEARRYSLQFKKEFLIPVFSAIATCSEKEILNFPANMILDLLSVFLETSPMKRWTGGTTALETALAETIQQIKFETVAHQIRQLEHGIEIRDSQGNISVYDQVIIGTQANQAAKLIENIPELSHDKSLLELIPYAQTEMMVHQDEDVMPRNKKDWAAVNYQLTEQHDLPKASIWINRSEPDFKGIDTQYFQTLNPEKDYRGAIKKVKFSRPICNLESFEAMKEIRHRQLSDKQRKVHFVGSYLADKLPLLENGVTSAMEVGEKFGIPLEF